jgi:quinol---cytochrome c reductase iron-sulfur subunit
VIRGAPRLLPRHRAPRWAELVVLWALLLAAAAAVGFIAVYALGADTQWLGLLLGGAFALLAVGSIVTGKALVPHEQKEEERRSLDHEREDLDVAVYFQESGEGITRQGFLKAATGVAGLTVVGAMVVPLASCGPFLDVAQLRRMAWTRGRRLVDDAGKPLRAEDIAVGAMVPAFAEGVDRDRLDASLIVVRMHEDDLHLPHPRASWAPLGILAFSKICTHAGCAIALYRAPLFEPTDPRPALVCPCHYSTFDPATGGSVIFGPAGRKLPMLPLQVDAGGFLRARGNFDSPVGPSWWGVRLKGPTS